MNPRGIQYKAGYKYQLVDKEFPIQLPLPPGESIFEYNSNVEIIKVLMGPRKGDKSHIKCGPFLALWPKGKMRIYEGYAWDGPSGPAFDTLNFIVPSKVHDALYQLMRNKVLPLDPYREIADEMMYQMCRDRGMCAPRAWWCKRGVRRFGRKAATVKKVIYEAP